MFLISNKFISNKSKYFCNFFSWSIDVLKSIILENCHWVPHNYYFSSYSRPLKFFSLCYHLFFSCLRQWDFIVINLTENGYGNLLFIKRKWSKNSKPLPGFKPGNTWLQGREASQYATEESIFNKREFYSLHS